MFLAILEYSKHMFLMCFKGVMQLYYIRMEICAREMQTIQLQSRWDCELEGVIGGNITLEHAAIQSV